jgi:amidohydrolase
MDALPIQEENEVPYRSQVNGKMHACGHDAHTAMLLGIARVLMDRRDEFGGTVKLLFQPAEEGGGGARVMIEEGVLTNPDVDAVFGMHMDQGSPVGTISMRAGPALAAADRFYVTIKGQGGHGAHPEQTHDPIVIGAHIVTALQTVVAREIDPVKPAVCTVGALLAGDAPNVIPDTAIMRGTLRSFDPEVRRHLAEAVERLVRGVAGAMRAEVDFQYASGYPPTVNDPGMTEMVWQIAREVVGEERVEESALIMGAEDFSYFLEAKPGCFYFVGSANDEKGLTWKHHHPKFDIDEESMGYGMVVMVRTVMRYLGTD